MGVVTLVKRILAGVICTAVFLICLIIFLCGNVSHVAKCDHCHETKQTKNQLVGFVDMQICNDCHQSYLKGIWGEEYSYTGQGDGFVDPGEDE